MLVLVLVFVLYIYIETHATAITLLCVDVWGFVAAGLIPTCDLHSLKLGAFELHSVAAGVGKAREGATA